jgi:TP901 family phage tail tape measure protein
MASPAAILQVFVNANTKVASAQLAAFEKQLQGVGKTSAATGAGMGKFTKGAAAAGTGIAAFAVAAGVAGKQLYDLGKQFDDAYDTIRVRTGATGKELEKLKRDFRAVATTVPDDFKTVGEAIGGLNQRLGATGKPLRQLSTQMLNLSRITGTDLDSNIKSVSRAFVDFEVPVKRQRRSLDGLFRLYQKSGASVDELASSVQRFGSPLRTLGFSFEEAAAMFANFERAGVNTQTMVPGLKLAIGNLVKPTDEFAKTMRQLGVDAQKPGPALRQIMDLLGPGGNLNSVQKMSLAMEVFGKRAGADMAEAIKQGRFNLDEFLKAFERGDTINKTAKDTNDFSENMKIFGNRLKILVRPAAEAVFNGMTKLSEFLASPEAKKGIKMLGQVFKTTFQVIKFLVKPLVKTVVGGFKAIKAGIRFIKDIIGPIKSTFESVKNTISNKLSAAYVSVSNFVDKIIDVINLIPGIPDIGNINAGRPKSFKYGPKGPMGPTPKPKGSQRGGVLSGGSPSGDSIPAMLERGEYVLNRKAVEKIGVKRLNNINFKSAPRFQKGGAIGLQSGGYLDTLTEFPAKFVKPIADAGTAALDLLMNGPGQFLKMLPKPNIPQPFSGVGPYLLEKATSFIKKNATSPLKDNDWVDSNTFAVARFLSNKFNASISSDYRSPAQNAEAGGVPNSSHTRGTPSNPGAFDFVPPSGGMQSFAGKNIAGIVENMIHDVGSGLHNHIAFFQKGGAVKGTRGVARMQRGGWIKGKTSWFSPPDAPNTTADGKHTAADPGFAMRSYETLGDWFWAKVGGKQGMLQHIDWGPAAWTGRTIDFTKAGLDKIGSSHNITDTMAAVKWLGPTVKAAIARAKKLKFPLGGKAAGPSKAEIAKREKEDKRRKRVLGKLSRSGLKLGSKKLEAKISGNGKAIGVQNARISLAEKLAGASFGPGGSDETPEEIAKQVELYTGLFELQKARAKMLYRAMAQVKALVRRFKKERKDAPDWKKPGLNKAISNGNKTSSDIRQQLVGLVGSLGFKGSKLPNFGSLMTGSIGDTNFRLRELGFTPPSDAGADSELASLLREQLTISQRNLAIAQAQAPVFQQFMPKFHQGGVVQGPLGAERPIMAQAGEGVFTRDQMRAMGGAGNITVVIEDGAIDSNRIRVEVDGVLQDKISTVRRTTPNRRYSTR